MVLSLQNLRRAGFSVVVTDIEIHIESREGMKIPVDQIFTPETREVLATMGLSKTQANNVIDSFLAEIYDQAVFNLMRQI